MFVKYFQQFYLLIFFLVLPVFVGAEESGTPVDITSESLELNQEKAQARFSGDVKVIHGGMTLSSDTLDVFYAGSGNAESDLNTSSVQRIVAFGHVVVIYGNDTATGNEAVYDPSDGTVILKGNVVLVRDDNVLKGDELVYDMETGRLKLNNQKEKGRIKATFSLKEGMF